MTSTVRAVICLTALIALWPSAAVAARLRLMLPSTGVFTTDGERYALYGAAHGQRVTILDTRTEARRQVVLPPSCSVLVNLHIRWPAALGRALLICNDGIRRLLDLRSGTTQNLPTFASWTGLGAAWASGLTQGGCTVPDRHGSCRAFLSLSSDTTRLESTTLTPDLDQASLPPVPACPGLRGTVRGALDGSTAGARRYERGHALIRHGPSGPRDPGLTLARCRRRAIVLERRWTSWERIVGGLASWTTGEDGLLDPEEGARPGTLAVYGLRTGRLRRWRLPRSAVPLDCTNFPVRGTIGESLHTRDAVFWVVPKRLQGSKLCDVAREAVYSAPLR